MSEDTQELSTGRPYATSLSLYLLVLFFICAPVGALYFLFGILAIEFGAWQSASPLTPLLIGCLFLGVTPGLLASTSCAHWEQLRSLVYALLVAVVALFGASLINRDALYFSTGGGLVSFLFSLGWIAVLGLLSAAALATLGLQFLQTKEANYPQLQPLPGWSKPLLALLASAWFGLGAGLVVLPEFWGELIPWASNMLDRQVLGALALALGTGLLGALAEDDLTRLRPALSAVSAVSVLMTVVLVWQRDVIDWYSGPGLSIVGLVGGLILTSIIGRLLANQSTPMEQ